MPSRAARAGGRAPSARCPSIASTRRPGARPDRALRRSSRRYRQSSVARQSPASTTSRARARRAVPIRSAQEPRACSRCRTPGRADRRGRGPWLPTFRLPGRRHAARRGRTRSRALRSRFTSAGTGSTVQVAVPGRGEYGNTCTFVTPVPLDQLERPVERGVVLPRKAHDHVGRQVESLGQLDPASEELRAV